MIWTYSSLSPVTRTYPQRGQHAAAILLALLLLTVPALGFTIQGGSNPVSTKGKLPSVTIEAAKEHALRLKVDQFVTSVVAQPWNDALERWRNPICPLVAGLPRNWGEFVLERISRAAIDAHAPLAGRVCHPNLYVLATDYPEPLLKKLWVRGGYRGMYHDGGVGIEAVERFIESSRAIRVWYNTRGACAWGGPSPNSSATVVIGGFSLPGIEPPGCTSLDSHISYGSTRSNISSAIVVIDLRRMKRMTIGQMADYVALVSLADVRLDADPGTAQSILRLFGHETPPRGLTVWDRALLYSLYHTSRWSKIQLPELEITMVRRIAP